MISSMIGGQQIFVLNGHRPVGHKRVREVHVVWEFRGTSTRSLLLDEHIQNENILVCGSGAEIGLVNVLTGTLLFSLPTLSPSKQSDRHI